MKYVKILKDDMCHKGFRYQLGLNIDHLVFNPSGSCKPGGLYFTDLDNFVKFLNYGTLIADVGVPPGTEIYADPEGSKWKAPRITLSNIRRIEDMPQWRDPAFCLKAVNIDGGSIKYVVHQTEDLCITAVSRFGDVLRYVIKQTEKICLAAVRDNGLALEHVYDELKTPDICLAAVKQNGLALQCVDVADRSDDLCHAAYEQNFSSIKYWP